MFCVVVAWVVEWHRVFRYAGWWNVMVTLRLLSILYINVSPVWSSDIDTMEMAWGVDIEPVLAMLSLAFGKHYKLDIIMLDLLSLLW